MESAKLNWLARRGETRWNEDGLAELLTGTLWVLMGGGLLVLEHGYHSPALVLAFVGVSLGIATGGWWIPRVMQSLKERVAGPRTGTVKLRSDTASGWKGASIATGLMLVAVVAIAVLTREEEEAGVWVARCVTGCLPALGYAWLAHRTRMPRFYFLAFVALAGVYASARVGMGLGASMGLIFCGMGAGNLLTGTWTLVRYLRRHPRLEEASL
jgi:hypothetical protein